MLRGSAQWPAGVRDRISPEIVDLAVALLLIAVTELEVALTRSAGNRLATAVGGAIASGAVAFRRRWPTAALLAGVGAVVCQDALNGWLTRDGFAAVLPGLLLFYGAGAFLNERQARRALALGVAAISLDAFIPTVMLANLFWVDVLFASVPWWAGRYARRRLAREQALRERTENIDATHERYVTIAAHDERARLAREIHDVIGHSLSVMVIQAAGARTVMDRDPDRAEQALQAVSRAGREAMVEMRRLLGLLGDGPAGAALAPQPGVQDLEQLIARTRAAGLASTLTVLGTPGPVSAGVGLCAYRIVQEALTNTIKHAAGASRADVTLRWRPDALELDVRDDGHGPAPANGVDPGRGLAGMRERVAAHGGTVETGPGAAGGFTVRAQLPLTTAVVR